MGVKAGPKISKDGLVILVDAENTRSYSGTGFTIYGLVGGIGGTLINGASFGSTNVKYFIFDGTNDYINFGTLQANTSTTCTVGCWVKTTTTSQCMTVTFSAYGSIYINRFNTSGKILAFFDGTTGNNTSADISDGSINDGNWHHISATNNGSICSMYIDGILNKTYSETPSYSISIYNQISGQADGNNMMNGSISYAFVYNRALTAQEILQNYNATKRRYGL